VIPAIGLMIGGYILLRCCELMGRAETQFSSKSAASTVRLLAVLCFLVVGFLTVDLLIGTQGLRLSFQTGTSRNGSSVAEPAAPTSPEELDRERKELQEMTRRREEAFKQAK
jgi:hypothetical protein